MAQPFVVTLHPKALDHYERVMTDLKQAIEAGTALGDHRGIGAIRDLVENITVTPAKGRGRANVEIVGRLNALIEGDRFFLYRGAKEVAPPRYHLRPPIRFRISSNG